MHDPRRILVFRNGSIGNTLAAVPALRCLRAGFPAAEIAVVVDPVGNELLANLSYFNQSIVYDRHRSDRGMAGYLRTVQRIRAFRPDTAILLKRFFRNGLLSLLSGASCRAGFESEGKAPFLNVTMPYDESIHVAELNVRLVHMIGAQAECPLVPEIRLTDNEFNEARKLLDDAGVRGEFIVAHFGGITSGAEFISMECRLELLRALSGKSAVVLIGSGAREAEHAKELARSFGQSVAMVGMPLRLSMSVISLARAFIGTNSGPMHIAAAARIPGIALFRKDDRFSVERVKWRPLYDRLRIVPVGIHDSISTSVSQAAAEWAANV